MNRRVFLSYASLGLAALPWLHQSRVQEREADVVILGGGVGGCAAALAALRNGRRVVLTEETDWIGGQFTQQGVPPDEHPWIEQFGAPQSYRDFRDAVRRYYRTWYPLTGDARRQPRLNPGACSVSALCHEPRVALAVLEALLAPYLSGGHLHVLPFTQPVAATTDGDRVTSVQVRDARTGNHTTLIAPYFLDATESGDLLPLTHTEYVTGAEAQSETGELHAPAEAQPLNMQAATWCFALEYRPGENHTIDRPATYDAWQAYVPDLSPPWPGRLLSLTYANPVTLEPRTLAFDPRPGAETETLNLWRYRRLADPGLFVDRTYPSGISLINWPQNDYLPGNFFEVDAEEAERHLRGAMDLSYALLYWLQTEAPRPDGGAGWPGLRLRGDVMGTDHGLAKRPYIRESRRIRAVFTVTEQHVGLDARMAETGLDRRDVTAATFPDAVGIGSYRIDLHPSTGGDNYIDISSLPFEIPLGALIPQRVENLLPACKNLGVTHITNGCYRLHPVEWNIGEAAGSLAAFCLNRSVSPRSVHERPPLLEDFQRLLTAQGVELRWPDPLRTPR